MMERVVKEWADRYPATLTADEIADWWRREFAVASERNPNGFAQITRQQYAAALKVIFRAMGVSEEAVQALPRSRHIIPRSVTVDDAGFEAVFEKADDATRLFLLLCRDAALRSGTACRVTAENIYIDRGEWYIRMPTKRGHWTSVPLTRRLRGLVEIAAARSREGMTLLTALNNGVPLAANTFRERVMRLRKWAAEVHGLNPNWYMHDLRRTAAKRLYEATRDIAKVQRLLSHKQAGITLAYLTGEQSALSGAELEQALEARRDNHVRHDETGTSDGAGEAEVPGAVDTIRGVSRHAGGFSRRGVGY